MLVRRPLLSVQQSASQCCSSCCCCAVAKLAAGAISAATQICSQLSYTQCRCSVTVAMLLTNGHRSASLAQYWVAVLFLRFLTAGINCTKLQSAATAAARSTWQQPLSELLISSSVAAHCRLDSSSAQPTAAAFTGAMLVTVSVAAAASASAAAARSRTAAAVARPAGSALCADAAQSQISQGSQQHGVQ